MTAPRSRPPPTLPSPTWHQPLLFIALHMPQVSCSPQVKLPGGGMSVQAPPAVAAVATLSMDTSPSTLCTLALELLLLQVPQVSWQ